MLCSWAWIHFAWTKCKQSITVDYICYHFSEKSFKSETNRIADSKIIRNVWNSIWWDSSFVITTLRGWMTWPFFSRNVTKLFFDAKPITSYWRLVAMNSSNTSEIEEASFLDQKSKFCKAFSLKFINNFDFTSLSTFTNWHSPDEKQQVTFHESRLLTHPRIKHHNSFIFNFNLRWLKYLRMLTSSWWCQNFLFEKKVENHAVNKIEKLTRKLFLFQ